MGSTVLQRTVLTSTLTRLVSFSTMGKTCLPALEDLVTGL
jgi:hypothetical protein